MTITQVPPVLARALATLRDPEPPTHPDVLVVTGNIVARNRRHRPARIVVGA